MHPVRARSIRLLEERGAITWVTALLLAGLAAAAYLAVVWVPVWLVHYEVKQVVRDYGNQAIKIADDRDLVEKMCHKLRTLDSEEVVDDTGRVERVPVVDVRPQDVTWERSAETSTLHVSFEYPRRVRYPWVGRTVESVLQVDVTMDISRADWGPMR